MRRSIILALLLLIGAGGSSTGYAAAPLSRSPGWLGGAAQQSPDEADTLTPTRLTASDAARNAFFGRAVAMEGNFLLVGAPGAGEGAGAAYVFERQGEEWSEVARLAPGHPQPGAGFGSAVAISGNMVAVGARYAATEAGGNAAGAAYVFERRGEGWSEQARLEAGDGRPFDLFGHALALEGDTLVVGARAAAGPGGRRNAGAAYVYQREQGRWVEQARLAAGVGQAEDFFGQAVAVSGDTAAVGAPGRDEAASGENTGAVYFFQRSGGQWFAQSSLVLPGAGAQAQFGYALAFFGPPGQVLRLAAGANQENYTPRFMYEGGLLGAVYLFELRDGSWAQVERIAPEQADQHGMHGAAVAINEDGAGNLLVASGGPWSRSIILLHQQDREWQSVTLQKDEQFFGLDFGGSLASGGGTLAVGASWDPVFHSTPPRGDYIEHGGAVYLYELSEVGR